MPVRVAVVSLNENEKDTLAAAGASSAVKSVADEIAATVRSGGSEVANLTKSKQLSAEGLTAGREGLQRRLSALENLPAGTVRDQHLHEVRQGLGVIEEALEMLG